MAQLQNPRRLLDPDEVTPWRSGWVPCSGGSSASALALLALDEGPVSAAAARGLVAGHQPRPARSVGVDDQLKAQGLAQSDSGDGESIQVDLDGNGAAAPV